MKPSKEIGLPEAQQLLSECVLFRGFRPAERAEIVSRTQICNYKAGETVFTIGSPGNNMMAVLNGTVRISVPSRDGRELMLAILQPGEVFGEIAVLDGKERTADAAADTACTLAVLDRRDILNFLEQHPTAWLQLVAVLCDRLRRADQLLADVALLQLPARLAKTMLRLIEHDAQSKSAAKSATIRFSQRELANMLGGTRESVNKCLAGWQRRRIVEMKEGRITILDKDALETISGSD